MVDWADGFEISNLGIRRRTDSRVLLDLLCIVATVLIAAAVLIFYSWTHNRLVEIGYEEQKLQAQEESLLRDQRVLAVEEETLKDPERVDAVALGRLGMVRLHANQLIPPQAYDVELGGPSRVILAAAAPPSSEPPKASASN